MFKEPKECHRSAKNQKIRETIFQEKFFIRFERLKKKHCQKKNPSATAVGWHRFIISPFRIIYVLFSPFSDRISPCLFRMHLQVNISYRKAAQTRTSIYDRLFFRFSAVRTHNFTKTSL